MGNRILFDASNVDITIQNGGALGTKAYLEAILALYPGQVDVLHPIEAHIRDPRYKTIDVPKRSTYQWIVSLLKGHFNRGAEQLIDILLKNPDVYHSVFINNGHAAGGVMDEIRKLSIKTIVLHHNFETEYQLATRSLISFKGRSAVYVRYWEQKGYRMADINLFVTQYDKDKFEKEYGNHPNNHVTGTFESTNEIQELSTCIEPQSAVITCALNSKQNVLPLLRFQQYYLSVFHDTLPDWELNIMGRNPSEEIIGISKKYPYVKVIPNPDNIRELVARCAVYLCPMDEGGGIKLRILDGLRAGQPILLHEQSARGYEDFIDEPFFITYNDTDSFKSGLQKLLIFIQSPNFSRKAIQKHYYELFGLQAGISKLRSVLC